MNQLNRIMLLALLVQVALTGVIYASRDEPRLAKEAKVFPGFDPAKVTKIKVIGETGNPEQTEAPKTISLAKEANKWVLSELDNYPVDQAKVDALLKAAEKLSARGPVVTKSAYFKKLEVADERFQRQVTLTVDGKDTTFLLGTSAGFKKVNLRKAGSDDVVQVEGLSTWDVGAHTSDWVDRNYFKVPESDVLTLELENKNGKIKVEKSQNNDWVLLGLGSNDKLKKSAVDELVRKASTIQLEEPVGKGEKPDQGFDHPLAKVAMVTGTSTVAGAPPKTTENRTVLIGRKHPTENRYFVKASTSEYVVTAPGWAVEPLIEKATKDLLETDKPKDAPDKTKNKEADKPKPAKK